MLKKQMGFYQIIAEQYLEASREEAWSFLSDPGNLQLITPKAMQFEIRSGAEMPMFPGQLISYRVSPFPGIRTSWVTEITHLREGAYFVDEQRFGPYRFWHHKHFVFSVEGGVQMRDVVDYALPLGPLGSLAHSLLVRKQLTDIFRYRETALADRFGSLPGKPAKLELYKLK